MKKNSIKFLFVLLVVTTICHFLIPSSFALFRSKVETTGSVELAKWDVGLSQDGVNDSLTVKADGEDDDVYLLTVRSNSEVDVVYSIELSNLPEGVEVQLDDRDYIPVPASHKITIDDAGTIPYTGSEQSVEHTLRFRALTTAEEVEEQEINVKVVMRQAL